MKKKGGEKMEKLVISSEELARYCPILKKDKFKELKIKILGYRLSGTIIAEYNKKCLQIQPNKKIKIINE